MKPGYGRRRMLFGAAFIAVAYCTAPAAQQPWRWPETSRVVVIPDVHGAHTELVGLLRATGIVDASLAWSGGDARLVSLGDLLDRGAESRKAMDLLMRLQSEAADDGGAVHVVLGNHEVMNLVGDLRYVSAAEYAAFADEEPAELRAAAVEQFLLRRTPEPGEAEDDDAAETETEAEAEEAFARSYPPGFFGHQVAFSAEGRYGSWLLSLPSLIVIGDTAFMHGGLPELVATTSMDEINRRVQGTLRRYLAIRAQLEEAGVLALDDLQRDADTEVAAMLEELSALNEAPEIGAGGPLWYRGSVYCNAILERPIIDAALESLDAERAVVGHTPTQDRRAHELHDGRLVMLDTGMLTEYYSGRPAALVMEDGETYVQYLSPSERLPLEHSRVEAYGLTEAEIVEALSEGRIEQTGASGSDASTATAVLVRHDDTVMRAIFHAGDATAAELELAAHALDRLLGLDLVPPTVAREFRGRMGALQLQYPDAITESQRIEQRLWLGEWCPIDPQLQLMYAFDILMFNTGRTRDNVLYRSEFSVLKLTDHDRAFGVERSVRLDDFMLPPVLRPSFSSLDREQLQSALGDWLDSRQIRALLARRDALLEHAATD